MTIYQKEQIRQMRIKGDSYGVIADALGLSKNTVKSFCRRCGSDTAAAPAMETEDKDVCPQCGVSLNHTPRKRQKRFCSDACRLAWWKSHSDKLNRQATYSFTCAVCGKPFTAYGNNRRKYCSRACFGQSRRVAYE